MSNDGDIIEEMLRQTNEAYMEGYAEFEASLSECHRINTPVPLDDIMALREQVNHLMPVQESIANR